MTDKHTPVERPDPTRIVDNALATMAEQATRITALKAENAELVARLRDCEDELTDWHGFGFQGWKKPRADETRMIIHAARATLAKFRAFIEGNR